MSEKSAVLPLARQLEIGILREDAHTLFLNKPAGLLMTPDRWDKQRPNLMGLLQSGIRAGAPWAVERGWTYAMNTHRLDFGTSGVVLVALDRDALHVCANLFRLREVSKTYQALVWGRPKDASFTLNEPIALDTARPGKSRIHRHGKPSCTRVKVLEQFRTCAFVEAAPETGRLHQIRVHLAHAGHPLVGDADYGKDTPLLLSAFKRDYRPSAHEERPLIDRPALHARSLSLTLPGWEGPVRVEADLPKDLSVALKQLRRYALA